MKHRERLLMALNHKEPDRIPTDFGAALVCSANVRAKPARGHPYDGDSPRRRREPSLQDLAEYPRPDPVRPAGLREAALQLREQRDFGVVLSLSLYPYNQCHLLSGFSNWLTDLAASQRFAAALLHAVADRIVAMLPVILREVGDLVDVICWGDDLSHRGGPLIDPGVHREAVKPSHSRVMDVMKRGTSAEVFFHSDRFVREFGKHISFLVGGCDSSSVLPLGTPQKVRAEVPPGNFLAMYECALEHGNYGVPSGPEGVTRTTAEA
jgi:hypothetical protein